MGLLFSIVWWLTAMTATAVAVFAVGGDLLLTLLARRFGKDYVGASFAIKWSISSGVFELRGISLGRAILALVEPSLGMPMDLEFVRLELFRFEFPLLAMLSGKGKQPPPQIRIEIGGLELGLSVNEPEKWLAMREDNLARFQQAVQDAARARLAKANASTAAIIQKLKELASTRAAVAAKPKQTPPAETTGPAPSWQRSVDALIDSFTVVVQRVAITIRDDHAAAGVGITLERFELGAARALSTDAAARRVREITIADFSLFVNAQAGMEKACDVLAPMTMTIRVTTPYVMQSLLMGAAPSEKRAIEVAIAFPRDIVLQLRPAQLTKLLKLLRPLSYHGDWFQRALVQDEASCIELSVAERDEYLALYKEQHALEFETGLLGRAIAGVRQKAEIAARKERLQALEANQLASRLLHLRSVALDWSIPSGGAALPHVSGSAKRRKDLRTFLATPVTVYVPELPVRPMFHSLSLALDLRGVQVQLLSDAEQHVLSIYAQEMRLGVAMAMVKVGLDELAMEVDLKIKRFGINDERNAPTNVFRRLLDQNPGATHLLALHLTQDGAGHLTLDFALQDFTLLVVFDPLLHTSKLFVPALTEDEETELKYLPYAGLQAPPSPERLDEAAPVYKSEVPQEYSPLLLGGMSLKGQVAMYRCEICLLGDSSSLKSHVLAFTSDTTVKIVSSSRHEAVEIELVDVALQPCAIVILEDAIDLEISGLRTILELEGEGVDLLLGYRLIVGDSKSMLASTSTTSSELLGLDSERPQSGANLWGRARTAMQKNKLALEERSRSTDSVAGGEGRMKAGARRKLVVRMSDFALNMSANDLGVLLSITNALYEAGKEDEHVVVERQQRAERLAEATRKLAEQRVLERLKTEFQLRDVDGGGTLDRGEISGLIASVVDCQRLTKDEFNETVQDFLALVDRDGSGDVSLNEFESVLSQQKIAYKRLHTGVVALTGQEYVEQARPRSSVPLQEVGSSLANASALATFWGQYEQQIGTTRATLHGMTPLLVQQKMVRAFKNYEYAQEAWIRLVNPALVKPLERSPWLLTKEMSMGSRGSVLEQLLSRFDNSPPPPPPLPPQSDREALRMFVHTIVSTAFGGFYIRLIDETVANRVPSIEVSFEELAVYANFAVWESELPTSEADLQVRQRARRNDYGVAKVSFAMYGKYYNPSARQVEPFLEYFPGTLDVRKEPDAPLQILFASDRYFQLNVTFAFMDVVKTNLATFSKVEAISSRDRPHIKEEGGLFWMANHTGVNLTYYVVAKKQAKEQVRVETVSAVASVPPNEAHPCVLLNQDEDLRDNEQQHLKEKQLRQAFRNADSDSSGELDTNEVRAVLMEVYEEEFRHRKRETRGSINGHGAYSRESTGSTSRESAFSSDAELDRLVDDFIAIADTDGSGQVSWEEFKVAIAKTREVVDRFVSIEIEGYEPLHNVPVGSIGYTQVYELTPWFEDVESEKSVAYLYQQGVLLLNGSDRPTRAELQKAYACFCRVRELDPHYEWIDSYYSECVRKYLPVLVAVHVSVDGVMGLQVKVSSAEAIRNDTDKPTECLLVDDRHETSHHNPVQLVDEQKKERFYVIPPSRELSIPLDLVDVGAFAIRQQGETEWSNFLPLSVREQRLFKTLTQFERREASRGLHHRKDELSSSSSSLSSSRMVSDKMGTDVALPNPTEYVAPGKEVVYPSTNVIDNQPTLVVEKMSVNDSQLGTWAIVIQPQLLFHNVLPCGVEYAIVQTRDCPANSLDSKGGFRLANTDATKPPAKIDYFQFVSEVNCRRLYIASGKSVQVFGLDLEQPAMVKMRLCASETSRGGSWSAPFFVQLNAEREAFSAEVYEVRVGASPDAPVIVCQQQWPANSARSLTLHVPYWIQNRTGLDFRFRLPKGGDVCSLDAHRRYFHGAKDVPLLAIAPPTKALLSLRPFQETAHAYEGALLMAPTTKKYLPNFDRVDWSEPLDMASVGTKGEIGAQDHSFVVAFEVLAAPSQFFRSKIVRLTPRVLIVNRVPRPLQVTPVMLDKKLRPSNLQRGDVANATLQQGEALVVYHFAGSEKHHTGLRLRDVFRDEGLPDVGDWSLCIPFKPGDDFNLWTRGPQGDGPAVNVGFANTEETIVAAIEDVSATPRYRIENRSTRFKFRYVQQNVKRAEELVINPLESHSFVWDDPLAEDRKLKVTPLGWKIPTLIDLRHIGPCPMLTANALYCEVYIDGATRVLAVGDTPTYAADRQRGALNDWLSNTLIDVSLHGVGLTIVDGYPQELMNLTMERLRVASSVQSRRVTFSLHHFQVDDMTANALYPVVVAPIDSGFNSDKQEGWLPQHGDRPFFSLAVDTTPQASGITIVNEFALDMHSIAVKLNLEYLLGLVNVLLEFIPSSDAATLAQQGVEYKDQLLTLEVAVPEHAGGHGGMLLYFKQWRMAPFDLALVFDSSAEDKGEGISSLLGSTVGSIVGGIAHVTPEFSFTEILFENRFFYEYDLVRSVIVEIVFKVLRQWYKIVGSVEMLGDPVGLATDIVDGLALAVRQLKRDVRGKSLRKGQSAMTIVQTVIGAPMKSLGKVSNGLGDVVKKATDFQSQENADQPRHVPEGLLQSGVVFTKSLAYGVKGFVKEPVRGAKSGGFKGFAKGVGRGTLQLVASPVVGTLGVVEKLTTSVSNTTHLMDEKQFEGTRRPARDLGSSALKPLADSNVITEVELHVLHVEGLPERANPQILVRMYQQEKGGPAHDVAKYKSSTLHHTSSPNFNQSWLLPVTSLETFIEVHVLHKRKPLPKKSLGHVVFSMEDIYREFEGVPANVLWDPKVKLQLRRRKRVKGSILNELALASSQLLEKRDDSWRQKMSRPSMVNFMDEDQDQDGEYEQDVELLSSRSIVVDQPLEVKAVSFPLLDAENPDAKIFLSVRYVNDMRR